MENLVNHLSKPAELLVYQVFGMSATGKACLELLWIRRFTDCKVEADCFAASTEALDETYARQV